MRSSIRWTAAALILGGTVCGAQGRVATSTCLTCHAGSSLERAASPARLFTTGDVHRESGFTCVDCHGGNPEAAAAERAHDTDRGFGGAIRGAGQIAVCARCHSDPDLMRRYAPRQRVDQAVEYATSAHGKRLA